MKGEGKGRRLLRARRLGLLEATVGLLIVRCKRQREKTRKGRPKLGTL